MIIILCRYICSFGPARLRGQFALQDRGKDLLETSGRSELGI